MSPLHPTPRTLSTGGPSRGHDARPQVCGGMGSSTAGTACSFPPRWQLGAPVLGFACNVHAIWALDRQLEDGHSVTVVKLARSSTTGAPNDNFHHQEIKP